MDLLSSKEPMLRPPIFIEKAAHPRSSKAPKQGSPNSTKDHVLRGDGTVSSDLQRSPRAGKTSKEIPYSLFDRAVQIIADRLNIGSAYKMYRLSSNLDILCNRPEEWKKDSTKARVLGCLLEECKDLPDFQSMLENKLAPISESLLSQGFAIAKKMQEEWSGDNSHGIDGLLTALAHQGLEKATKRIVSLYESSEGGNELNLLRMSDMLFSFMTDCPDIEPEKIKSALIKQFKLALAKAPNCAGLQTPADESVGRFSAFCSEKTFQARSNTPKAASKDTELALTIEQRANLERTAKLEGLEKARKLLDNARNIAGNGLVNIKNSDKSLIGAEITDLSKSHKDFLSKKDMKKELNACFTDYYKSIRVARFGSREAETVIRKLYDTLAALEENNLAHSDFNYFLCEIETLVTSNAVGGEGDLLEKVWSEKSRFKKENADMKKFWEFSSITTVSHFSKISMDEFRVRQKQKSKADLGNGSVVVSSERARITL